MKRRRRKRRRKRTRCQLDLRIEDYLLSTSSNPKWAEVCKRNVDERVDCLARESGQDTSSTLLDFCETSERPRSHLSRRYCTKCDTSFFASSGTRPVWLRGSKLPLTFRSINPGVYMAYRVCLAADADAIGYCYFQHECDGYR